MEWTANKYREEVSKPKKKNKFNAVKTTVGGKEFDSKKESQRYTTLMMLYKAGEISMPETQVRYPITINGIKVCSYVADFVYTAKGSRAVIVEDTKSEYTRKLPVYRLKKKLMQAVLGIAIKET